MGDVVSTYKKKRQARLDAKAIEDYRERSFQRWAARMDAEEEENGNGGEKGGSHGNTKIPFGLCQREGIKIEPGWGPKEAWDALAGKGYSAGEVYKELRDTGKIAPRKEPPMDKKRANAVIREYKEFQKQTKALERERHACAMLSYRLSGTMTTEKYRIEHITKTIKDHESMYGTDRSKLTDAQRQERDDLYITLKDANDKYSAADAARIENNKKIEEYNERVGAREKEDAEKRKKYREAVLVKYPTFADCKSATATRERFDVLDLFDERRFGGKSGFADLELDAKKDLMQSAEDFFKKVPAMKGKLGPISVVRMSRGTYAESASDCVRFNREYYSDPGAFEKKYEGDVSSGFHPANTTYQSILYHEYAHQIDDYITRKINGHRRTPPMLSTKILDEVSKNLGMSRDQCKWLVSRYAKKRYSNPAMDDMEFLAEAFAEYLGSPSPRPVAAEVGKIMERYIKEWGDK